MPNVGWGELMVIVLVALIVFGPAKLPDMMKSLGKGLRAFQEESSKAMDTLRSATEDTKPNEGPGVIDRPDGWVEPTNGAASTPEAVLPLPPAPRVPPDSLEDT